VQALAEIPPAHSEHKYLNRYALSPLPPRPRLIMSSFSASLGLPTTFSLSQLIHWVNENRTLSLGGLLGFCILFVVRYATSPYRKLPPGPRGYPVIGNVLELRTQQWLKFTEWRKQYGQGCSNLTLRLSFWPHQVTSYTSTLPANPWSS
jgi:hypothetical protein